MAWIRTLDNILEGRKAGDPVVLPRIHLITTVDGPASSISTDDPASLNIPPGSGGTGGAAI